MQSALDRRYSILEYMCEHRHESVENLMFEFNVSRSTIKRDIEVLSMSFPLYTTKGVGGGVHVADGYNLRRKYLSDRQVDLLERVATRLTGEEFSLIQGIIRAFGKPMGKRK